MKKRGISPVIATVLLIAIVSVIALIVFMWFRGFTKEACIKFEEENIELSCEKISFEAEYTDSIKEIAVLNLGNVPIYEIEMKIVKIAGYETKNLKDITNWPNTGLKEQESFSGTITSEIITSEVKEIILIPRLLGKGGIVTCEFKCDEQYGVKIVFN